MKKHYIYETQVASNHEPVIIVGIAEVPCDILHHIHPHNAGCTRFFNRDTSPQYD